MTGGKGLGERLVLPLVVLTVCLSVLSDVLPRVGPWLVVLAVLGAALRLVFVRTRGW